jgi:hypothetical protein
MKKQDLVAEVTTRLDNHGLNYGQATTGDSVEELDPDTEELERVGSTPNSRSHKGCCWGSSRHTYSLRNKDMMFFGLGGSHSFHRKFLEMPGAQLFWGLLVQQFCKEYHQATRGTVPNTEEYRLKRNTVGAKFIMISIMGETITQYAWFRHIESCRFLSS